MRPICSEAIDLVAAAICAAQAKIELARRDQDGETKGRRLYRYSSLASAWAACKAALAEQGLAVLQPLYPSEAEGHTLVLRTVLMHKSGQFLASEMPMDVSLKDPQAVGSWVTYARKYSLCSMVGVCTADDDGARAMGPQRDREPRPAEAPAPRPAKEQPGRPAKVRDYGELVGAALDYWGVPDDVAPDYILRNLHRELLGEAVARNLLRDPGMLDDEGVIREMRRVHAMHPSFVGSILRDEEFARTAITGVRPTI